MNDSYTEFTTAFYDRMRDYSHDRYIRSIEDSVLNLFDENILSDDSFSDDVLFPCFNALLEESADSYTPNFEREGQWLAIDLIDSIMTAFDDPKSLLEDMLEAVGNSTLKDCFMDYIGDGYEAFLKRKMLY